MNNKAFMLLPACLGLLLVSVSSQAAEPVDCTLANGCASLSDHDGYWVGKIRPPGKWLSIKVINDMYINPETNRVTVYAQSRLFGQVVAPAQLAPGECEQRKSGRVCSHPDAVYLNGSGEELSEADGNGGWWVKHSWVLDGEGYDNSELKPMESYPSLYVEGVLLDDGLTMKIGNPVWGHNLRRPVYSQGKEAVTYEVIRFQAVEQADGSYHYEQGFHLNFRCEERASAFDGKKRGCPKAGD